MLTREQRRVLKALNKFRRSRTMFSEIDFYNEVKIFDRDKMRKLCRELDDHGYFEILSINVRGDISMIELSYKGIIYKQLRRREVLQYIGEKWIDFLALITSVAALVISVIALLSTGQC